MSYTPEQGDIITLEFDPQAGHEQKGRRPAIVVSNNTFNNFTKIAMVCPITNTNRGFPLHVVLDARVTTTGVVMCEQVKLSIYRREMPHLQKRHHGILSKRLWI